MENKESTIRSLIHNIEYKKLQYKIFKDVGSGDKKSIDEYWEKQKAIIFGEDEGIRVIFLDIDGVLNNENMYKTKKCASKSFDPKNMEVLNDLIYETQAKVVISSCWRIGETIESLLAKMKAGGYKYDIYDFTPRCHGIRGNEIHNWLKEKGKNVKSYVIFDDDSDMLLWQKDYFIWIDRHYGLTPTMAYKAKHTLLNRSVDDNYYYGIL